jgi:hypothetical protein
MTASKSQLLLYTDTSDIREGALDELKKAIEELVEFIDANEPQILAYNVYLSDDEKQMTVMHLHATPESLDFHMDVAGPAFRRFADLITLTSIRLYGEPSEKAVEQLHDKAHLLGTGSVVVKQHQAGFSRL